MIQTSPDAPAIGIDFGTSNTVVALADEAGRVEAVRFNHNGASLPIFVTALCFSEERRGAGRRTLVEGGPWAVDEFVAGRHAHRFIQSFKTFAASPAFQETRIFRERFRFEDLMATFLRTVKRRAGARLDFQAHNVVVGRPVRFAGVNPDDALAMRRYDSAFAALGAQHARYAYEPVGAAFFFARTLDRDATVLVADFGGGTSDFSVIRFERADDGVRATPLGHAGVGIAGDVFDYRIVDHVVSPRLGKGGFFRSFDKVLSLPSRYYANFARWHQLQLMKSSGELRELRELERSALEPEKLRHFIDLIEYDHGFDLYRAVSEAKIALSSAEETELVFAAEDFRLRERITRTDFQSWIATDLQRLGQTIDEALSSARTPAATIDKVLLTGGTSHVPAVRQLFLDRFGEKRLTSSDHFESITYGLALIAASPDSGRWTGWPRGQPAH